MTRAVLAALVFAGCAFAACAQDWPTRPIRFVVTFPPGGGADLVARTIAEKLNRTLGQQVIIDNRPGGGTVIGADLVAHAAPDGYTLLFGTGGGTFLAPIMLPKVSYDPQRDFAPVAMLVMSPQVLVTHPSVPANSVP